MPDNTFLLDKYIFPLFAVTQGGPELQVKRFLGSGFWADEVGHFITCKHVLDGLAKGELPVIGQPFSDRRDHFIRVLSSVSHPTFDIAVATADIIEPKSALPLYRGPLGLGLDVQAFGFTDAGRECTSYQLDVRLLRGYVSRHSPDSLGLPSPSLLEVSFGSPSGFSGTPLMVGTEVIGVMYRNIETKLEAYSIQETTGGQSQFREVAYRIYEYGIAHSISDLSDFLVACNIET
ncbi:MAG: serine protease [Candidatus Methylophosphatis roskildensis]